MARSTQQRARGAVSDPFKGAPGCHLLRARHECDALDAADSLGRCPRPVRRCPGLPAASSASHSCALGAGGRPGRSLQPSTEDHVAIVQLLNILLSPILNICSLPSPDGDHVVLARAPASRTSPITPPLDDGLLTSTPPFQSRGANAAMVVDGGVPGAISICSLHRLTLILGAEIKTCN